MFDQIFLSSQVKRSAIISNEHGLYELPHQLPNDFRLNASALSPLGGRTFPHKKKKKKDFGKLEISVNAKTQKMKFFQY